MNWRHQNRKLARTFILRGFVVIGLMAGCSSGSSTTATADASTTAEAITTASPTTESTTTIGKSADTSDTTTTETTVAPSPDSSRPAATLPLEVDDTRVGANPFGTLGDAAVADITTALGAPTEDTGWVSFIPGTEIEDGEPGSFYRYDEYMTDSWEYPHWREVCWDYFCIELGGDTPETGALTGWVMSSVMAGQVSAGTVPVVLAGTNITLGSRWDEVQAAFPEAEAYGGEGTSLVVRNGPYQGIFDGVGAWRMTGAWDYQNPNYAAGSEQMTRLSGGEGPEPGCC